VLTSFLQLFRVFLQSWCAVETEGQISAVFKDRFGCFVCIHLNRIVAHSWRCSELDKILPVVGEGTGVGLAIARARPTTNFSFWLAVTPSVGCKLCFYPGCDRNIRAASSTALSDSVAEIVRSQGITTLVWGVRGESPETRINKNCGTDNRKDIVYKKIYSN
jgi:hypothetical protein